VIAQAVTFFQKNNITKISKTGKLSVGFQITQAKNVMLQNGQKINTYIIGPVYTWRTLTGVNLNNN